MHCPTTLQDARRVSTTHHDVHDQWELPVNKDTARKQEPRCATETAQCIANPLNTLRGSTCMPPTITVVWHGGSTPTEPISFHLEKNLLAGSEIERKQKNCYEKRPKPHLVLSIFRVLNSELQYEQFSSY